MLFSFLLAVLAAVQLSFGSALPRHRHHRHHGRDPVARRDDLNTHPPDSISGIPVQTWTTQTWTTQTITLLPWTDSAGSTVTSAVATVWTVVDSPASPSSALPAFYHAEPSQAANQAPGLVPISTTATDSVPVSGPLNPASTSSFSIPIPSPPPPPAQTTNTNAVATPSPPLYLPTSSSSSTYRILRTSPAQEIPPTSSPSPFPPPPPLLSSSSTAQPPLAPPAPLTNNMINGVPLFCPASNNTVTSFNGFTFTLTCGAGSSPTSGSENDGETAGWLRAISLTDCIDLCSRLAWCGAFVHLQNSTCLFETRSAGTDAPSLLLLDGAWAGVRD
ncbi:hypothetical protein B0T24DRAFT_725013 [Lasiosphaeria ovina]|uniref:Apple domain-containing protein n=1 Tax=Lasiosphaeria ovina TaxID=92902 RepID=A0AAE0JTH3_9PEZI|nr:hypothetical protein B0T24DRAFT_725013 [Lasiosphaeria ovina]